MCNGIVGTVKVKPLVLKEYPNPAFAGPDVAVADAPFSHRYQVQRDPWAHGYMAFLHPSLPITSSTLWWESKGHPTIEASKAAAQADYEARIMASLDVQPITVQDAAETDAERFDRADWFWRVIDPDDSADTPSEAIHRGMIGDYCVCKIASSYTGPVRFGFTAPVLDPDSDDTEFLHFETQQEAIDAAKARAAALRAIADAD